jgi:TM2 domain-containing membrane protein YozV
MKSIKQISFLGLVVALVLSSCSAEKRVYMSGYHMTWNKSKQKTEKHEVVTNKSKKAQAELVDNKTTALANTLAPLSVADNVSASAGNAFVGIAKLPAISVSKNETTVGADKNLKSHIKKDSKKNKKASKKSAAAGEGKSQLVALLLALFIGVLGIHRFYLGYMGIGIIQLLTLGGFGIWALIDLIMIITGSLKPKDGNYEKPL